MTLIYPAVIHDDSDCFWIEFPDLKGCFTQGDTLEEVLYNAKEALECHALSILENGGVLPKSSNPKKIILKNKNAFQTLVQVDINLSKNAKSVRKSLTIPSWLNERALEENVNFSGILQKALLEELKIC